MVESRIDGAACNARAFQDASTCSVGERDPGSREHVELRDQFLGFQLKIGFQLYWHRGSFGELDGERVVMPAADAKFVMQMSTCCEPRATHVTDDLTLSHPPAGANPLCVSSEVGVEGGIS